MPRNDILALPGVPYEMKILVEHFFKEFKKNRKFDSIVQKTIFIRNIPESQLATERPFYTHKLSDNKQ